MDQNSTDTEHISAHEPNWHLNTPELPRDSSEGPLSYLGDGSISLSEVEAFFQASRALLDADPWNADPFQESVRLDIPQLGIESGFIVFEDHLIDSKGFTIFASDMSFNTYLDFVSATGINPSLTDLGVNSLSLDFRPVPDLPAQMHREIRLHGWPALDGDRYPWLKFRHRSRTLLQPTRHVFNIVIAATCALAHFYTQHADVLQDEELDSLSHVHINQEDLTTRLTYPYGIGVTFDLPGPRWPEPADWPSPPAPAAKVPRNAPCPCGSGSKYKKCCLKKGQKPW